MTDAPKVPIREWRKQKAEKKATKRTQEELRVLINREMEKNENYKPTTRTRGRKRQDDIYAFYEESIDHEGWLDGEIKEEKRKGATEKVLKHERNKTAV